MAEKKTKKFFEGLGGRKTASARVRIFPGKKEEKFIVNEKEMKEYFPTPDLQKKVREPLNSIKEKMEITVKVRGGGPCSQAEAVSHGLSRALIDYNPELKAELKVSDLLTRDPRRKERKKPGLKRARRAPQWRKR